MPTVLSSKVMSTLGAKEARSEAVATDVEFLRDGRIPQLAKSMVAVVEKG